VPVRLTVEVPTVKILVPLESQLAAMLIAEAAKRGISLEGTNLYVTDFPCPPCAKLIARSGITRLYFSRGYAVLDGESTLKNKGVELVFVDVEK